MKILFFECCIIFFILCGCQDVSFYAQETGKDIAQTMWTSIKSIKPSVIIPEKFCIESSFYPVKPYQMQVDDSMQVYWESISEKCQNIFIAALAKVHKNNQIENFAKEYATFFGRDGCVADMRWVLACPRLTTPDDLFVHYHKVQNTLPKLTNRVVLKDEFKIFSIAFVKAIVENSLKSKEYCKRMHHLTIWWGFSFDSVDMDIDFNGYYREIVDDKLTKKDFAYWHAIRRLISIAYLCDCDSILTDILDATDKKNIVNAYRLILDRVKLLGSFVSYDQEKLRYMVRASLVLPTITPPSVPFCNSYFSNNIEANTLPRISHILVRSTFAESFTQKITIKINAQ